MKPGEDYRFQIDAYTPDTMPMARLAEYLAQLAAILGEEKAVHFVRLEPGSTEVVHRVEAEAVPKVRARAKSVRRGSAPRDAVRAYHRINRLLREDAGKAVLVEESTGAEIIDFPGREDVEEQFSGIKQRGAVDGEVVRVGGLRRWVPVILRVEEESLANCYANHQVAKRLGARLFEPVRLFGFGRWSRDAAGTWVLERFIIDEFETLRDEPLSTVLARLAAIPAEWGADAYDEVKAIRQDTNGGS